MRKEFEEFLKTLNLETTLEEIGKACQTDEELACVLDAMEGLTIRRKTTFLSAPLRRKALLAFQDTPTKEITTVEIQKRLFVGYGQAVVVRTWLVKQRKKIMDINDRFLLSLKQMVEMFGAEEKYMTYKKIPYTQGLQYSCAWWAGGNVERYKKMPVCVSGLGVHRGREICIPHSYQNKWGNEVPVIGIRDKVFASNPQITDIIFPSSIEKITSNTFSGCFSLERIALPKKITFIPQGAFRDCQNLKDIYYEGSENEWGKINIVHKGIRVKSPQKLGLHCQTEEYEIAGNEPVLNARIHFNCR